MQNHQQQTVILKNFECSSNNVGKTFNWSKKSYVWSFEAEIAGLPNRTSIISQNSNRSSIVDQTQGKNTNTTQKYRIQFMDSLNSGKRTVVVNDVVTLHKVKIQNFGGEPYQIVSTPIDIKISKHTKKGSMFKNYELLICDKEFSLLKQLGGPYQMTLSTVIAEKSEKPSEQISPNSSLQTDLTNQSIQQSHRKSQITNNSNIFSPNSGKDDTFDFNFQSNLSEIQRQPSHNFDFDFSCISGVSNNNATSPQSQNNASKQQDNVGDNFFRSHSHSVVQNPTQQQKGQERLPQLNLNLESQGQIQDNNGTTSNNTAPLQRAQTERAPVIHQSPFQQEKTNNNQGHCSPGLEDYFNFNAQAHQEAVPQQQNTTQQASAHKPPQHANSSKDLHPFDDFFGTSAATEQSNQHSQPQNQRCQSSNNLEDLLCFDSNATQPQPTGNNDQQNQNTQQQEEAKRFNPAPYSFITERLSQIPQNNFYGGFQTNMNFPVGTPTQMPFQTNMQQSPMNNNAMYASQMNFMTQMQNVNSFGQHPQMFPNTYAQQQQMFNTNNPNMMQGPNIKNNKDLTMQHILKEVSAFAQNPQGFDRFERERQQQLKQKESNDQLSQQLGSLLKFE